MTQHAVLFDVGCVLIDPDGALLRDAAVRVTGLDLRPAVAVRALAETVWTGALAEDPVAFWNGPDYQGVWAVHAGLAAGSGPVVWTEVSRMEQERRDDLWSVPVAGAFEMLTTLAAQGTRMAAVSNGSGRLDADLRRHRLRQFFDVALDSHVEGIAKPDPQIFRRAAERLGVDIGECVFVGDDPYFDIAASMRAGVAAAVLIDRHRLRGAAWSGYAAESLGDVPATLAAVATTADADRA